MNTYAKFAANVFVAKCSEKHEKGDIIKVTTKHGKEHDCVTFNLVLEKDGFYYYSVVRADGYNLQERARLKSARYADWALSAQKKSDACFEAAREGADFLALGEPIKVGHHSEKSHRALLDRNDARMRKAFELRKKADEHFTKSDYWESRDEEINLSMPESIEFYKSKLEKAKEYHLGLKSGKYKREHGYSLQYAKKEVNEADKNYHLAMRLWG